MNFGENKPFLLFPCKKLKIQKKFDHKVVKIFFSKINNIPKTDQFDQFWDLKKCFRQFYAIFKKF